MELNYKNIKKIILIIFCGAVIFTLVQRFDLVFSLIAKIYSFVSPIVLALSVAFVLNVFLTPLETKLSSLIGKSKKITSKLCRPICLVITYLIAFGIISLLILVIIPDLFDTVVYIAEKLPTFINTLESNIGNLLQRFDIDRDIFPEVNWYGVATAIKNWVIGSESEIFGDAVNITTSVFSGAFNLIFSLVISVYVLAQKEKIGTFTKRFINAFIPSKVSKKIYAIASQTQYTFSRFIGGQLTEAIILGILCLIGMLIFRFPNALIISLLIAVTALVPIIGATIGVIIGALLICITSPLKAVLFVAFFLVLQQIEGNLIYPKVVGKAVGLPGIIVVCAVLLGGNIGGVTGALIAVPTSAVIYTLLKEAIAASLDKKSHIDKIK